MYWVYYGKKYHAYRYHLNFSTKDIHKQLLQENILDKRMYECCNFLNLTYKKTFLLQIIKYAFDKCVHPKFNLNMKCYFNDVSC